jgi:hypothetical protein
MPRKTTRITITEEGRDKGKAFVLTELPADQAERWAIRAMLAMVQSGADISPETMAGGMASFAALGVQALGGVSWEQLEPLLAEMWQCVQYSHAPNIPLQSITEGVNSQIEEVATRFALRVAVLQLHMNFFIPEATPTSGLTPGESEAATTPTFLGLLGSWYRRALQR